MDTAKKLVLYTDGSCLGNPGPGGWAVVMLQGDTEVFRKSGGAPDTTNNRMELMAVITGLSAIDPGAEVEIHSDSKYVIDAFEKGWLANWKSKGWTRNGEPLKNDDLWKLLDKLAKKRTISWVWVKGHNGNKYNEICDQMAVAAAQAYQKDGELAAQLDPVEEVPMKAEEPEEAFAEEQLSMDDVLGMEETVFRAPVPVDMEAPAAILPDEKVYLPVQEASAPGSEEALPLTEAPGKERDMSALVYLEDFIARRDREKIGFEYPCGGNPWCDFCSGVPEKGGCSCAKAYVLFADSEAVIGHGEA